VVLEKALGEFSGTICFISHDRRFINTVANKVLVAGSGGVHVFPGNYDDYERIWKNRLSGPPQRAREKPEGDGPGSRVRTARKRAEAQWRNELFRARKPVQDQIEGIERDLDSCHAELDQLRESLADSETYREGRTAVEIQTRFRLAQDRVHELTARWEEKVLELEQIEENFRSRGWGNRGAGSEETLGRSGSGRQGAESEEKQQGVKATISGKTVAGS
jgi:ATP-binding cassette subfamily F protein 3